MELNIYVAIWTFKLRSTHYGFGGQDDLQEYKDNLFVRRATHTTIVQLVTDELVEVGDFRRVTNHFRGIFIIRKNRKMSTCNWLDLESLGY